MVIGLGRGKNNNGEVKIAQEITLGRRRGRNMVLDTGRVKGLFAHLNFAQSSGQMRKESVSA